MSRIPASILFSLLLSTGCASSDPSESASLSAPEVQTDWSLSTANTAVRMTASDTKDTVTLSVAFQPSFSYTIQLNDRSAHVELDVDAAGNLVAINPKEAQQAADVFAAVDQTDVGQYLLSDEFAQSESDALPTAMDELSAAIATAHLASLPPGTSAAPCSQPIYDYCYSWSCIYRALYALARYWYNPAYGGSYILYYCGSYGASCLYGFYLAIDACF